MVVRWEEAGEEGGVSVGGKRMGSPGGGSISIVRALVAMLSPLDLFHHILGFALRCSS